MNINNLAPMQGKDSCLPVTGKIVEMWLEEDQPEDTVTIEQQKKEQREREKNIASTLKPRKRKRAQLPSRENEQPPDSACATMGIG
jgi:hypothetical protein